MDKYLYEDRAQRPREDKPNPESVNYRRGITVFSSDRRPASAGNRRSLLCCIYITCFIYGIILATPDVGAAKR